MQPGHWPSNLTPYLGRPNILEQGQRVSLEPRTWLLMRLPRPKDHYKSWSVQCVISWVVGGDKAIQAECVAANGQMRSMEVEEKSLCVTLSATLDPEDDGWVVEKQHDEWTVVSPWKERSLHVCCLTAGEAEALITPEVFAKIERIVDQKLPPDEQRESRQRQEAVVFSRGPQAQD